MQILFIYYSTKIISYLSANCYVQNLHRTESSPLKFNSNTPASYDLDLRAIIYCLFITNLMNHYVSKLEVSGARHKAYLTVSLTSQNKDLELLK